MVLKRIRTTDRRDLFFDETFHEEAFVIFLQGEEVDSDALFHFSQQTYFMIFAVEFLVEVFDTPDIRGDLEREDSLGDGAIEFDY